MRKLSLALVVLLAASLAAQTTDVVIPNLGKGKTYYLKVVVAADGTVTHTVLPVSNGGTPTDPTPNPNPNPNPTSLEAKVARWTAQVQTKPETIGALIASSRALLRPRVESGDIAFTDVFTGKKLFSKAYDTILTAQGEMDAWKEWRTKLGNELATLTQDKKLDEKDEVTATLKSIEDGLQQHLARSGLLERIDVGKIIVLIKTLSDLGVFGDAGKFVDVVLVILEIFKQGS